MEKIFENFTVSVLKLNKLVQRIKQFEMREYKLKSVHVMCVYYLNEHPEGLTSTELVKLTLEDKAAISRALKAMQDRGFVTYDPNKHNAPVRLTDEGKRFAEYILERANKAVEAGSAVLSEDERNLFYKSLGSIAENLTNYYDGLLNKKD